MHNSNMPDKYSPELLALLRQMQDVAAKDPMAAKMVANIDPEALDASNGLWKPNGAPGQEAFAFTNNPDQRLYQQELAKAQGMPQGQNPPTLADILLYRKQMDNQPRQAVAALSEEE